MSQINFCSQCGAPLTDVSANFCSKCGYKFAYTEEVKHVAPASESTIVANETTINPIKNLKFTKYGRLFGIMGVAISLLATIIIIYNLCTEAALDSAPLSINRAIFGISNIHLWNSPSLSFMTFILIVLALLSQYYLRRFADTQTTSEDVTHIRKVAFGLLITIIGGILSFGSIAHIIDNDYYDLYFVSFINIAMIGISLYGIIHIIKHLNRYQQSANISDGIRKYIMLTKILTFIILATLSTAVLLEFIFKVCYVADVLYNDEYFVMIVLYSLLMIVIFSLVGVISTLAIIRFSIGVPTITDEEHCMIDTRLTECSSNKRQLTNMLYIFASISLMYAVVSFANMINSDDYLYYGDFMATNFKEITGLTGFGGYLVLFAIATIFLIHKAPNQNKWSMVAIISMIAGGFNTICLQWLFGYLYDVRIIILGLLPLCAGYILYIWFSECDRVSKIIITALSFMPLIAILICNDINHHILYYFLLFNNFIVITAAYIYVIIRINGIQSVKDKLLGQI